MSCENRVLPLLLLGHRMPRCGGREVDGESTRIGIDFSASCIIMHYCVNKIPVGVLGASGYAGRELCALILRHPDLSLAFATANEQRGATVRIGGREVTFVAPDDAPIGWRGAGVQRAAARRLQGVGRSRPRSRRARC